MDSACPICKESLQVKDRSHILKSLQIYIDCFRCGTYIITHSFYDDISQNSKYYKNKKAIAKASFAIQNMQNNENTPAITQTIFEDFLKRTLPSLPEQLNNFVLWIGNTTEYGEKINVNLTSLLSIVGAINIEALRPLLISLEQKQLMDDKSFRTNDEFYRTSRLSFRGWEYYEKLKQGEIVSKKAFIAMKYGDIELDRFITEHLRSAVEITGFRLERLDENHEAGLIDAKLRVAISTSRFLIADLTHDNNGAYWEAGYAEGLGLPVIYICKKSKFDDKHTHFDTNHHLTVLWDNKNPNEFVEKFKATIRATLPNEAKMIDS